jgi:hypothetical protein
MKDTVLLEKKDWYDGSIYGSSSVVDAGALYVGAPLMKDKVYTNNLLDDFCECFSLKETLVRNFLPLV